eukprot:gene239-435_t
MVLPMPTIMANGEPPPAVAKLRPWFIGVVAFQFYIWGGFYMLILVCLGAYAVKDGVNVMFTTYYGFMALITGIFDLVAFIDMMAKGMPYYVPGMFLRNLQIIGLSLSCPTCLVAAWLSWKAYMYNDAAALPYSSNRDEEDSGGLFGMGGGNYGTRGHVYNAHQDRQPSNSSFTPFSGQGNTLGGGHKDTTTTPTPCSGEGMTSSQTSQPTFQAFSGGGHKLELIQIAGRGCQLTDLFDDSWD